MVVTLFLQWSLYEVFTIDLDIVPAVAFYFILFYYIVTNLENHLKG